MGDRPFKPNIKDLRKSLSVVIDVLQVRSPTPVRERGQVTLVCQYPGPGKIEDLRRV